MLLLAVAVAVVWLVLQCVLLCAAHGTCSCGSSSAIAAVVAHQLTVQVCTDTVNIQTALSVAFLALILVWLMLTQNTFVTVQSEVYKQQFLHLNM